MFNAKFWITAFEVAVTTFAATLAGSLVITTTPSAKGLLASLVAAGVAALAAFLKQVGGVQALKTNAAASRASTLK